MTREESIALFSQGREAWNKWADGRQEEKRQLEKAGFWDSQGLYKDNMSVAQQKIKQWMNSATVDFSLCIFTTSFDSELSEIEKTLQAKIDNIPRGKGNIRKRVLRPPRAGIKQISLINNWADFNDFVFPADVTFFLSHLEHANFERANFAGDADRNIRGLSSF